MSVNRPGIGHVALDAEIDFLRVVADYGPLTGRYLAAQEARQRSAHGGQSGAERAVLGVRPAVASACRRLGAACIALGLRWQGSSRVARGLVLPGEQNAA